MLVSEVISIATSIQMLVVVMVAENMSDNMKKGMNALRCASISGLVNVYLPCAAAYFAAR